MVIGPGRGMPRPGYYTTYTALPLPYAFYRVVTAEKREASQCINQTTKNQTSDHADIQKTSYIKL